MTPLPTAIGLQLVLAATAASLVLFLANAPVTPTAYLLFFTALFAVRVTGQLVVLAYRPAWLPPMDEWNFVPYRFLLPAQLAILALMGTIVLGLARPGDGVGCGLVVGAVVYWAAMAVRYAVRMARQPDQRWLGGTIPIVFHGVLAAFLFVLGASHAA